MEKFILPVVIIVGMFILSAIIDMIQGYFKERKRVKKARQRQDMLETMRRGRK